MSKSKKNVVDPEQIIEQYGADVARWFMLSDSPPDRDVEWTTAGAEGAWNFLQRVWRIVDEVAEVPAPAEEPGDAALELRRVTHRAIAAVTEGIEGFGFNKALAKIYELRNAVAAAKDDGPGMAFARREACETLARLMAPMVPHFAEEAWAALGHDTMLVDVPWPQADPGFLVSDTVTMPIQVNGKKRGEIEVAKGTARDADRGGSACRPQDHPVPGRSSAEEGDRGAGEDRECRRLTGAHSCSMLCGSVLALPGCLRPMLAADGPAAGLRGRITLPRVDDRFSYFLEESLARSLGRARSGRYRLDVSRTINEAGVAIAQDNSATRITLLVEARWRLIRIGDGAEVMADAVTLQSGYNATTSLYATRQTRRDIERRLARDLGERIARAILARAEEIVT